MFDTRLNFVLALSFSVLFFSCAPKPKMEARTEPVKVSDDKIIATMITKGKIFQAQKYSDSLSTRKDSSLREIGTYWKTVCWLYRDEPDSALAVLDSYQGKWSSGIRKVHVEVFLNLARDASHVKALLREKQLDASKSSQDKNLPLKVETLQQEVVRLHVEISHLESERHKYQTLLKDLEDIH